MTLTFKGIGARSGAVMVINKKSRQLSPQSGRTKIAQRFIAGKTARCSAPQSAKRTTETIPREGRLAVFLSPVSRALVLVLLLVPSTKVLGYFQNVRFADGNRIITMSATQNKEMKPYELKVLAEGFHSSINHPFVAVARDADPYAALRNLAGNLPKLDSDFFKSNVVVAAFLGERNTGGYSVEISLEGSGGIRLVEHKPGKGMMVPQVITSPFKIVSFPVVGTMPVVVAFEGGWEARLQSYHVTSGTFTNSGGFAGTVEKYPLEGKVSVMREDSLATFSFLLKNAGEKNEHLLFATATGIVESDGAITIKKLSAFTFVSNPNSGLQARAKFTNHDTRLLLEFSSLPSMIADGYGGSGSIEAIIIGPALPAVISL